MLYLRVRTVTGVTGRFQHASNHRRGLAETPVRTKMVAPVAIFWHTTGHAANNTVLVQGGNLAGAVVTVCDAKGQRCEEAAPLDRWNASIKFQLPMSAAARPSIFRACDGTSCSTWQLLNAPVAHFAIGDSSVSANATSTAGGWLRVFGRALHFAPDGSCRAESAPDPGLTALLRNGSSQLQVSAERASCFEAHFAIPVSTPIGTWELMLRHPTWAGSSLAIERVLSINIEAAEPWPSQVFPVSAGGNITAAVASANAAGGIVQLGAGDFDLGSSSLFLAHNVQLIGSHEAGGSVLRRTQPASAPLVGHAAGGATRYALRNVQLSIEAASPRPVYIINVAGHGVRLDGVVVRCDQTKPTCGASLVHTTGTGWAMTDCNMTGNTGPSNACTNPGYPFNSLLFFDAGTESGIVANSSFAMGCGAFASRAAKGLVISNNSFTDLPRATAPESNALTTFGGDRVSERLVFSHNSYQGTLAAEDSLSKEYPHEAFTTDGTSGAYAGNARNATATAVTVPRRTPPGCWPCVGHVLAVLSGPGQGQIARVVGGAKTGHAGNTYYLAEPLLVPLTNASIITVTPPSQEVYCLNNSFANTTTVQVPAACRDQIPTAYPNTTPLACPAGVWHGLLVRLCWQRAA